MNKKGCSINCRNRKTKSIAYDRQQQVRATKQVNYESVNRFKLDAFKDYDTDEFHGRVEDDLEVFQKQCDSKFNW